MPCYDCSRPYGNEHGFPDLLIPSWAWRRISPKRNDGGLLCPSCICKRLVEAGIECDGWFASGPIRSVNEETMQPQVREKGMVELPEMSEDSIEFGDNKIYLDAESPITISLPHASVGRFHAQFPNFNSALHVLNVDRLPDWWGAGDFVVNRRGRTFVRSLTQTEPRWKQVWRKLKTRLSKTENAE